VARTVIALYNVASVQRLLDFIKTVYAFNIGIPAIIKPSGAAAQVGVPEAHRISYRYERPLIVLPELSDLGDTLGIDEIYLLARNGEEVEISNIPLDKDLALVVHGGDGGFTKAELQYGKPVKISSLPSDLPPQTMIAIILYEIVKMLKS